jgi:hypothetical protein
MRDRVEAPSYYDWASTLSYAADVTMVITSRGRGKTYGLRLQCIRDFLKDGSRFAEICRYQKELGTISSGYFDKLAAREEFKDLEFKVEGRRGWIRRQGEKAWDVACYFVALSEAQNAKKRTYTCIRRMIFDEALIEPGTFLRYLSREWQLLTNLVDTLTREHAGVPSVRPHLYMLANACDLVNPYFVAWGIDRPPSFGYSWHVGRTVLLHYEDPGEYAVAKARETLAGRMAATSAEGGVALSNEFAMAAADDIARKPPSAKFWIGLVYMGQSFGVWIDWVDGYYYVNRKIPSDATTVYSLTRLDNSANRLVARRATPALKALGEGYYSRLVRFDSVGTREQVLDAMAMFGIG